MLKQTKILKMHRRCLVCGPISQFCRASGSKSLSVCFNMICFSLYFVFNETELQHYSNYPVALGGTKLKIINPDRSVVVFFFFFSLLVVGLSLVMVFVISERRTTSTWWHKIINPDRVVFFPSSCVNNGAMS